MLSKSVRNTGEIVWLIIALLLVRPAVGATATATVSVTILPPAPQGTVLTLSTKQLDMRGKISDEITIVNSSDTPREVHVSLAPPSDAIACRLHYAPMQSAIPANGVQVIRLMIKTRHDHTCAMEQRLIFTDPRNPHAPLFDVPVITGHT